MIDRIATALAPVIAGATKELAKITWKGAAKVVGAVSTIAVAAIAGHQVGEKEGHKNGVVKGMETQAKKDKVKMDEMNAQHQKDREKWEKERQEQDALLDEAQAALENKSKS